MLYFWSCVAEQLWNFIFVSKKSRRRTTAQTELLLLILFIIPRPEWSVQLFSALCVGTDYETTAA